jgi:hypothetical protein
MSLRPITNIFADLSYGSVDHSESTSVLSNRECEYRKANKKLSEIAKIRERSGRLPITKEQEDKLSRESEWRKIIDLYDTPHPQCVMDPAPKSKSKLEKERKIREKKETVKRENERKAEVKRQHEERCKEEARKYLQRLEEERDERKASRERAERLAKEHAERNNTKEHAEHSNASEQIKTGIHIEYMTLCEKNKDPKKAFHQLSLKYHPDKNNGKEDWAKLRFQFLNEIHSKYA